MVSWNPESGLQWDQTHCTIHCTNIELNGYVTDDAKIHIKYTEGTYYFTRSGFIPYVLSIMGQLCECRGFLGIMIKTSLFVYLNGPTSASFCLFPFFLTAILQKIYRIEQDSNTYSQSKRHVGRPRDHVPTCLLPENKTILTQLFLQELYVPIR